MNFCENRRFRYKGAVFAANAFQPRSTKQKKPIAWAAFSFLSQKGGGTQGSRAAPDVRRTLGKTKAGSRIRRNFIVKKRSCFARGNFPPRFGDGRSAVGARRRARKEIFRKKSFLCGAFSGNLLDILLRIGYDNGIESKTGRAGGEKGKSMKTVIKIGTSTLTYENGCVNIRRIEALCKIVSDLMNAGNEIILVSSGAIGMGVGKLRLGERPHDIAGKQACAAVGQCELMYTYDKLFSEYRHTVAQLLLTAPDLASDDRRAKFEATMDRLLSLGVLPIINENDTVATEEIEFGDNDTLAAKIAVAVGAKLLILLSDIDGLYSADPHKDKTAKLIPEVHGITAEIEALGSGAGSSLGTGGMVTKVRAAKIAGEAGCDMIIASGASPKLLYDIFDGKSVGTRFYSQG